MPIGIIIDVDLCVHGETNCFLRLNYEQICMFMVIIKSNQVLSISFILGQTNCYNGSIVNNSLLRYFPCGDLSSTLINTGVTTLSCAINCIYLVSPAGRFHIWKLNNQVISALRVMFYLCCPQVVLNYT